MRSQHTTRLAFLSFGKEKKKLIQANNALPMGLGVLVRPRRCRFVLLAMYEVSECRKKRENKSLPVSLRNFLGNDREPLGRLRSLS